MRVERSNNVPFFEQAAVPYIESSICFIVAENDEMENCRKEVQQAAFQRAAAAKAPKTFVEVRTRWEPPTCRARAVAVRS